MQSQNPCNCGSFSHQRTNHSDCLLNINNLRNNTPIHAESNSFVDSLGCSNPRFVFSQSDLLPNNQQQTQIIEAEHENNSLTQNQNPCSCGSFNHRRTSHSDCRLNINNLRNNRHIDIGTNSFINSLRIVNPRFVFSQSDLLTNNEQQTQIIEEENDNLQTPIYRPIQCRCGSTDHQRITHRECRLNKRLNSTQYSQQIENQKKCRCGSTTHQRISHSDCPLNLKRPRNSQGNQIETIEDFDDLINGETNFINLQSSNEDG
jgi:hypothetical protein